LKPQESIRRRSEAKLKLKKFAEEQEESIRRAEEEARKKVTRELLARFDIEFAKLSLEFEQKQKDAVAASEQLAQKRLQEALAEWESERRQLLEAKNEWVETQSRLTQLTGENSQLQEKLKEMEAAEQIPPPVAGRQADGPELLAEIARVEAAIEQISKDIDAPATDLAVQIRLNRERSEFEAYVRGLRFQS
jgi:hypothetical protein